jgi:hypothetical protein
MVLANDPELHVFDDGAQVVLARKIPQIIDSKIAPVRIQVISR